MRSGKDLMVSNKTISNLDPCCTARSVMGDKCEWLYLKGSLPTMKYLVYKNLDKDMVDFSKNETSLPV